jgi:serine/threonine protein kinase
MPLQPLLDYAAPEITRGQGSSSRTSTDIFSLACVAYHLITRRSLLQCNNNLRTVRLLLFSISCYTAFLNLRLRFSDQLLFCSSAYSHDSHFFELCRSIQATLHIFRAKASPIYHRNLCKTYVGCSILTSLGGLVLWILQVCYHKLLLFPFFLEVALHKLLIPVMSRRRRVKCLHL